MTCVKVRLFIKLLFSDKTYFHTKIDQSNDYILIYAYVLVLLSHIHYRLFKLLFCLYKAIRLILTIS